MGGGLGVGFTPQQGFLGCVVLTSKVSTPKFFKGVRKSERRHSASSAEKESVAEAGAELMAAAGAGGGAETPCRLTTAAREEAWRELEVEDAAAAAPHAPAPESRADGAMEAVVGCARLGSTVSSIFLYLSSWRR